jgi:hypothetical protein
MISTLFYDCVHFSSVKTYGWFCCVTLSVLYPRISTTTKSPPVWHTKTYKYSNFRQGCACINLKYITINIINIHCTEYVLRQLHTILFFKTKHVTLLKQISISASAAPFVCFRYTFMAATGHLSMNKFLRKSFLLNTEEKLVP